jgi:hypothetical protein
VTPNQKKLLIVCAAGLTLGLIYFAPKDSGSAISEPAKAKKVSGTDSKNTAYGPVVNQRFELSSRESESLQITNKLTQKMFSSTNWMIPPPPLKTVPPPPPPPPPPPTAPAMPYVFMGRFEQDSTNLIILSRGNRVVTAAQGDILEKTYRVDSIDSNKVTMTYLPLGTTQFISIGSTQ